MSFKKYLQTHYVSACEAQRNISNDFKMVEMLRNQTSDSALVQKWMLSYNLFRGVTTDERIKIADAFILYANDSLTHGALDSTVDIKLHYGALLSALYKAVDRGWISATSKLLWCAFPKDFVIYDEFVYRALVVLQCVDDDLSTFSRIGVAPQIKNLSNIDAAVQFYMNYQAMVKHLQTMHQRDLDKLRKTHKEKYKYDIRIIDKLLWMIGNAKDQF
jgi:hypothetical protein